MGGGLAGKCGEVFRDSAGDALNEAQHQSQKIIFGQIVLITFHVFVVVYLNMNLAATTGQTTKFHTKQFSRDKTMQTTHKNNRDQVILSSSGFRTMVHNGHM